MGKRLACMHAHHSNIHYIDGAFSPYEVDLVHFVDPGLMSRLTHDLSFQKEQAGMKIAEQINWMESCQVDGILLTCTNYIALLQEEHVTSKLPIFKIDEPFFEAICGVTEPQTIFFSNPGTVKGTMDRLHQYAAIKGKTLPINVHVIEGTFDLMMKGMTEQYNEKIAEYITLYRQKSQDILSVGQLSMYDGAKQTGLEIINPLDTLVKPIVRGLGLNKS
ncbi:hypothetical protein [Bacillus sp. FJAT-27986]|uniref:hypothetical protein n=1 Tax=Bacillus sp. FJAT-27986 TaxID=1743146 RepID=UPI00080AFB65|nr:hypothetical protein [Bacillus sp. FJAT-27986]OCA86824.1 hypothetical protein A8L44_05970 [Bacillus sp. FJAT-27986]